MTNKSFFTLFNGNELHRSSPSKVIPAESISPILEASQILDEVKEDVLLYRKKVAEECEKIKETAYHEGYQEGFKEWSEKLADFETKLIAIKNELQKMIIPIAIKAAKKIVGRELELSEQTIIDIVATNLKSVSQHRKITIYVNKKELEILERSKPRLKEIFEHLESLSIRTRDDLQEGDLTIETEVGIVNAQMEQHWKVLGKALEVLSNAFEKEFQKNFDSIIKKSQENHQENEQT